MKKTQILKNWKVPQNDEMMKVEKPRVTKMMKWWNDENRGKRKWWNDEMMIPHFGYLGVDEMKIWWE